VSGAMDISLAQELIVIRLVNYEPVRALILRHYQPVTAGVHGEHRDVDLSVVDDVLDEKIGYAGIGCDAVRLIQRVEIGIKAEPGGRVQGFHFFTVGGARQLLAIVHAGVKRWIAAGAELKLGPEGKIEWEIYVREPQELVEFLRVEIGGRRFRRRRIKPSRGIAERRSQGDARAALGCGLRPCQQLLADTQIGSAAA
jgi:hypothetical protein